MDIDVLGLGDTVRKYKAGLNVTIGVNDIHKFYPSDFIVIADPPNRFTEERRATIRRSKCIAIISHYHEWSAFVDNFRSIKLARGRGVMDELNSGKFVFSNNSPFIAAVLAYKLGAKRINLYGVDLTEHPSLGREAMLATAKKDYANLSAALLRNGVQLRAVYGSALNDILPLAE